MVGAATAGRLDASSADSARVGSVHFSAVRTRLAPGGLFCQWLPLHQLDLPTLRSIVQSFIAVYPDGLALLASNSLQTPVLGLLGRADRGRFDITALQARLQSDRWSEDPAAFGIPDVWALLGSFVAGPDALAQLAGDTPANTDDRPLVAYRAPRVTYAPESPPRDRLMALLRLLSIEPRDVLADAALPAAPRLAAYWRARQRFLQVGHGMVEAPNDLRDLLAQVREPLLAVLRISPDFRPAHDPLQRMALALQASDPAAARALLDELAQAGVRPGWVQWPAHPGPLEHP